MYKVPHLLNVEETFLLGLTIRQCLLLFIGACMGYLLFLNGLNAIPDPTLALVGSSIVTLLFEMGMLLAAFYRIGGRGLEEWGLVLLLYVSRPRVYLWHFNRPDAFERLDQQHLLERSLRARRKTEEEEW